VRLPAWDLLIFDQGAALQRRRLAIGEPISAGLRDRNAIAVRGVRPLLHGCADVYRSFFGLLLCPVGFDMPLAVLVDIVENESKFCHTLAGFPGALAN
jgi:hypothetical protein